MELTKIAIKKNVERISGLEGYSLLVSKIERNVGLNPDIAIETCKSLVEGLSLKALSLLSFKYNSSKKYRKKCENNLTFLTNNAFKEVYSDIVEAEIYKNLSELLIDISVVNRLKTRSRRKIQRQTTQTIGKISALRNARGDISHGRVYPKDEESQINLAKSIESITDGICSFMIHEFARQYDLKKVDEQKLKFKKLGRFNDWLNNQHDISSVKIDISRLLYDNTYQKYEDCYSEYIDLIENENEPEENGDVELSEQIFENEVTKDVLKKSKKVVEDLINNFEVDTFWSNQRLELLSEFSIEEELKNDELKSVINNYLFSSRDPLRDEVVNAMNKKPVLKNRAEIAKTLTKYILAFANELKMSAEKL